MSDWLVKHGLWNESRSGYPLLDRASGPYAWPLKALRMRLSQLGWLGYSLAWNDWRCVAWNRKHRSEWVLYETFGPDYYKRPSIF